MKVPRKESYKCNLDMEYKGNSNLGAFCIRNDLENLICSEERRFLDNTNFATKVLVLRIDLEYCIN